MLLYIKKACSKDFDVIETADNGLVALQKVKFFPNNYFDVIILDLNMPIVDGFEACTRI